MDRKSNLERRLAASEAENERLRAELELALGRIVVLETRWAYITDSLAQASRFGRDSDPVDLESDLACGDRVVTDAIG